MALTKSLPAQKPSWLPQLKCSLRQQTDEILQREQKEEVKKDALPIMAMKDLVSDQEPEGRIHPTNDVQAEQGVQNDTALRGSCLRRCKNCFMCI